MPRAFTSIDRVGSRLWTPALLPRTSLRGWYDMADLSARVGNSTGSITRFRDKSPLGLDADSQTNLAFPLAQTIPMRGVRADIVGARMIPDRGIGPTAGSANPYGLTDTQSFAMFAVFKVYAGAGGASTNANGTYIWDRHPAGAGNPLFSLKISTLGNYMLQVRDDNGNYITSSPIGNWIATWPRIEVCSNVVQPVSGQMWIRQWFGGQLNIDTLIGGGGVGISVDAVDFNYENNAGALTFVQSDWDFAEWIMLGAHPDTATRQLIEGYLAHKWGGDLCVGHPYQFHAPIVGSEW